MFGLALAAAGKVLTVAKDKFVPEAVKRFGAKVSAVAGSVKDGVSNVANKVSAVPGSVKDGVSNVANKVSAVAGSVKDGVSNVANKVSAVAGSVKDGVSNFTNVFKDDIPRDTKGRLITGDQQARQAKKAQQATKVIAKDTSPTQSRLSPE